MPELPEVETMRRGISHLQGAKFQTAEFPRTSCRPIQTFPARNLLIGRVVGQTVTAVNRRGKRVLVELGNTDNLVFEPRMTGLVGDAEPPDEAYIRFTAMLRHRQREFRLYFWDRRGLGSVHLLTPRQLEDRLGAGRLGPDALNIDEEALRGALANSRRAVKVALLDQQVLAGVGNIYASEILHEAGVHPAAACCRLTRHQWRRIATKTREVLELAIHYEGSTLADGTYRNALNQQGSYQNHHRVYDRQDEICRTCGSGRVKRVVQAQRATFFCPACQRKTDRKN